MNNYHDRFSFPPRVSLSSPWNIWRGDRAVKDGLNDLRQRHRELFRRPQSGL